jgi:hypothetical protein
VGRQNLFTYDLVARALLAVLRSLHGFEGAGARVGGTTNDIEALKSCEYAVMIDFVVLMS